MNASNHNEKTAPGREIANANLFADDIVFSDTEKVLFEDESAPEADAGLMNGNPAERYSIIKKLNEGGMKAIWEVDDHRTARKVAMALIQEARIASKADIDAFLYEARLTSNLQHPNIIPIYDIALDENGNPYFTMKALKGETLGEILGKLRQGREETRQKYTHTHLLSIFLKVCDAISYAHSKGVIHLDLKPSNINVGDHGDVQVLDWGLSTLVTHLKDYGSESVSWHSVDDVSLENGQTLTRYLESTSKDRRKRNVVGGTPGYMAPEQAEGSPADITVQTDVYMLGALLYEILTYHCPITASTVKEALQKTVRGEIQDPAQCAPDLKIPAALSAIVMKAMQTLPADRYATVDALTEDLQKYQDGFATSAENPTFATHLARLIRRHKMAVSLIVGSGLIILIVLLQSMVKIKQSEQVALRALGTLQEKNNYIAATAQKVAPTYLDLSVREEKELAFAAAEQAIDTCLAFDPALKAGWIQKAKILLAQQKFAAAQKILNEHAKDSDLLKLADSLHPNTELSELLQAFQTHDLAEEIPRLFYHLNQSPFDPARHFPQLKAAIQQLNPEIENLHFTWKPTANGTWKIDLGGNPALHNIAPLCGLKIRRLTAAGSPDLRFLTETSLRELLLSGAELSHLPQYAALTHLRVLDISKTRIRNLSQIAKYTQLTSLDISGIEKLIISPQLAWCQNLRTLAVSETLKFDSTIQALANHGVILIYTVP